MRFDVITLFPEFFEPFFNVGVNRRAFLSDQLEVRLSNPRDFADGKYRRVDDRCYGGGPGMVMMAEPLARCLADIQSNRGQAAPVILFSPTGERLDQAIVTKWAKCDGAVLVCGRYEGIDQRFVDAFVTHQISLGDFVMSGGEIAAMAMIDAIARLQPGVLQSPESHEQDSFSVSVDGLLDCPHYTRPRDWRNYPVPEVLLSGNHSDIELWRRSRRLEITANCRPDVIAHARAQGLLKPEDEAFLAPGQ